MKKYEKYENRRLKWTQEDIDKLIEYWEEPEISIKNMSRKFHRSEKAIKMKAQKLKLGARDRDYGKLTVRDIYEGMHITYDVVYRWFKKGLKSSNSRVGRKSTQMIDIDDFLIFLENNPDLYNGAIIENNFIRYLGKPQFLLDKIEEDKKINKSNHYKLWTNEEDIVLDKLFKLGLTNEQIAEKMGRTISSIECRLMDLSLTRASYNAYEIDIIKENADKMTTKELAKLLPLCTEQGIIAKCKVLGIKYHMSEKTIKNVSKH